MITTPPIGSVLVGRYELVGHIAGDTDRYRNTVTGENSDHRTRVDVEQGAAGDHRLPTFASVRTIAAPRTPFG